MFPLMICIIITVNLAIKKGETMALVGPSGQGWYSNPVVRIITINDEHLKKSKSSLLFTPQSAMYPCKTIGKSTIMHIIERFYDPTSGTIEFDGRDLKTLNIGEFVLGLMSLVIRCICYDTCNE